MGSAVTRQSQQVSEAVWDPQACGNLISPSPGYSNNANHAMVEEGTKSPTSLFQLEELITTPPGGPSREPPQLSVRPSDNDAIAKREEESDSGFGLGLQLGALGDGDDDDEGPPRVTTDDLRIDVQCVGTDGLPSSTREDSPMFYTKEGREEEDTDEVEGPWGEGIAAGVSVRVCEDAKRLAKLWRVHPWLPEFVGFANSQGVVLRLSAESAYVRFTERPSPPLENYRAQTFALRALIRDPPGSAAK
eukprot:Hpha_TRINITY_DN14991_c2_g1::TRINITY_DN14991_c2_g1_i6::g.142935::m.142935